MGRRKGKGPVGALIDDFGNGYDLSRASGVPAPTIYAAVGKGRDGTIANARVCIALARTWVAKHGGSDRETLAMICRLAGLEP